MRSVAICLAIVMSMSGIGCESRRANNILDTDDAHVIDVLETQQRQNEQTERLLKEYEEQNERYGRLLTKWEEQARRQDAILDAEELRVGRDARKTPQP